MKKKNKTILKTKRPDDRSPGLIQLYGATADALADMASRGDGFYPIVLLYTACDGMQTVCLGYCNAIH